MEPFGAKSLVCRLLPMALLVTMLTACGASTRLDGKPVKELGTVFARPPAALEEECRDPVLLPDGPLSAGASERAWVDDRLSLVSCAESKAALSEFYRSRDAGLAGKEK